MASQLKWTSAKPRSSSAEISRNEMLTKLKIFHDKFGTDLPPVGADTETIRTYYHKAQETIEDNSNKNYSVLQESLQEFVNDGDGEDIDQEKSGCCSRFWEWFCSLSLIRSCIPRVED